ncbi:MAG TPA: lipid-A-disaccharide synthase [Candidatus Hydrothermia bacterium]|nr:lipid-A-disaccharide synthase [Candidatus Hydrothermia bacterium]HRD22562.1 lipid-A-disaccharide synthase [Candidatus Hydrothermia bacterium]
MNFFISCGEISGDMHASALVKELKKLIPSATFTGIGGDYLRDEGVETILDINEMGIIGFVEAIKSISTVNHQLEIAYKHAMHADCCIFVDYPGFNLRLARRTRKIGKKNIYYILPQVWAWGAWRLKNLRKDFDLLLSILPFEEAYFQKHNVKAHFCGNPVFDRYVSEGENVEEIEIPEGKKIIGILPGSRGSEINRILPYVEEIITELNSKRKDLFFIISRKIAYEIKALENTTFYEGSPYSIMKASDVLLVKSGTATLEAGLFEKPMVVIYKGSYLSYVIAKMFAKTDYISLVNLILGEEAVPEYVQKINTEEILQKLIGFLDNSKLYTDTVKKLKNLKQILKPGAAENAARTIYEEVLKNGYVGVDQKPS